MVPAVAVSKQGATVSQKKRKVALVTGANRGIGLEVCRQLAHGGFHVLLTARNRRKGQSAADRLHAEGLDVVFQQLDVTSARQIECIRDHVADEYGRLDVLVNNAGVCLDHQSSVLDEPMATFRKTLKTNFYAPLELTRAFMPMMKANNYGRIVNVSSSAGLLSLMTAMEGRMAAYRISKAALNAVTRLTAGATRGQNIKVNSVCPGSVKTRMGGPTATRTVDQGAETVIWLATLGDGGPSGFFFKDRKKLSW